MTELTQSRLMEVLEYDAGTGIFRWRKKWKAEITVHGKRIHLGYFADLDEAVTARQAANEKYNFHANQGT